MMVDPMNKSIIERIAVGTSILLFSLNAFSFTPSPEPDPDPELCQGECDFTRGPNPSSSYLEATRGPYAVDTATVSRFVSGFGGGTIHYPKKNKLRFFLGSKKDTEVKSGPSIVSSMSFCGFIIMMH